MNQLLVSLQDLAQLFWDSLLPILSAVWAVAVVKPLLGLVFVFGVAWAYQEARYR